MRNSLKYIKNILKVIIWPIIFVLGQFFIEYIFVAIFNIKEKGTMTNNEFLNYIKTVDYKNRLHRFKDTFNNFYNDAYFCTNIL